MKLYDSEVAPNPRRLRIFLAEKGIEIPRIQIDLLGGENLQPEYLALNPRGLVPLLELDDGTRFDEVMAICRYFEEIQPEPRLLGRTPVERALVESQQRRMEFDGMIAGSEVFRNQHPGFAARSLPGTGGQPTNAIPALVERGTATLKRFFANLEQTLSTQAFLVGDTFTMADITAFCAIDFAGWVDITIPAENTATRAWYDRIAARDSATA